MMKRKTHWGAPLASLLILLIQPLPSKAALQIHWSQDWSHPEVISLEPKMQSLWFQWESKYKVFPVPEQISVEKFPADNLELGHSYKTRIAVSSRANPAKQDLVLKHELAHSFFSKYCPALAGEDLFQESFALYESLDYRRIFFERSHQTSEFVLVSKAIEFLKSRDLKEKFNGKMALALSRILIEKIDKSHEEEVFRSFYSEIFKKCSETPFDRTRALSEIEKILFGEAHAKAFYPDEEAFILLDGLSGLPLVKKGEVDAKNPPASTLKPILIASAPSLKSNKKSRRADTWVCDPEGRDEKWNRKWTWKEALVKSCNGFFLDSGEISAKEVLRFNLELESVGIQTFPELQVAHCIGLLPGIEASVSQMAYLYRNLGEKSPETLLTLQQTPRIGTLVISPEAKWFSQHKIALKSGTVRDIHQQPMIGWLVAVSSKIINGKPAWVAAYWRKGRSPKDMLWGLREYLLPYVDLDPESVSVQILGLVPDNQIKLSCPDGNVSEPAKIQLASAMKLGQRFRCPIGPVQVEFVNQQGGKQSRDYFGEILKKSLPKIPEQNMATIKQSKARRGSSLKLETSMINYSLQTLTAEYPRGREETLKALALSIQGNARAHRHPADSICDTTHCQVFGGEWLSLPQENKKNILQTVLKVEGQKLLSWNSPREVWFPFSLGGTEPWNESIRRLDINRKMNIPNFDEIIKRDREIKISMKGQLVKKMKCEEFRNSLGLRSCPEDFKISQAEVLFSGFGEGHDLGLNLKLADAMAAQGYNAQEILQKFYPHLQMR